MHHAPHAPGHGIPIRFDPVGDFLSTYTGPASGDLDVVVTGAFLSGPDAVILSGTHAAPIGATAGAAYVWGIDRGAGTDLLAGLEPSVGEGVAFDSVVVLLPDGTGSFIDLVAGTPPQALDPASISISGPTISVALPASLLPSQGFDFADYGYNLWPRFAPDGVDPGDNTQISDFAPDASTFTARPYALPEPGGVDWDACAGQAGANLAEAGGWYL
ncbi:hypothetical protein GCM10009416_07560 [Craurococcus roseus]|uniref:Uncharacterized protein n=1 Tax=Craurococcus roseus TaxID=77585 RepID=A0ABP3PNR6_9PROT